MDAATLGGLLVLLLNLALAVLQDRQATRPQRQRDAQQDALDDDLGQFGEALAGKDAHAIAQFFERERLARWRMPHGGAAGDALPHLGLHPDGATDPKQPGA